MYNFHDYEKRKKMAERIQNRVERYKVPDEEIKHFLFETSTKELCRLGDETLTNDYSNNLEYEMDKIIDIIAQGLAKKYLTEKQRWCLASFIIYYKEYY